jgi:hypothetical protein
LVEQLPLRAKIARNAIKMARLLCSVQSRFCMTRDESKLARRDLSKKRRSELGNFAENLQLEKNA